MKSIVLEREKLELGLAQAEAALKELKAELAKAVSALVNTVNDAARIDANRTEAGVKVDNARARCRQLQAALDDPGHSERITRSRERLDTHISQSEIHSRREAAARESSRLSSEQAIRIETVESKGESGLRKLAFHFKSALARLMRG